MSIQSGGIRAKSRELSETALKFGRLLPSHMLLGILPKFIPTLSRLPRGTSTGKIS